MVLLALGKISGIPFDLAVLENTREERSLSFPQAGTVHHAHLVRQKVALDHHPNLLWNQTGFGSVASFEVLAPPLKSF